MEKERLTISHDKVTVEYEFLNDTDQDITTQVAFPVPVYGYFFDNTGGPKEFSDFHVCIDDVPLKYGTEIMALVNRHDYAALLRAGHIDISNFGHYEADDEQNSKYEIAKLSKRDQQKLIDVGLINSDDLSPQWKVRKTYYWTQTFPAHRPIKVKHSYTPAWGWADVMLEELKPANVKAAYKKELEERKNGTKAKQNVDHFNREIRDSCIDEALFRKLTNDLTVKSPAGNKAPEDANLVLFWVDYILTTANSWKTPIKDFELIVEKPNRDVARKWYVTLCWDGPIEKIDDDHFSVKVKNFVPTKELHVAFAGTKPSN